MKNVRFVNLVKCQFIDYPQSLKLLNNHKQRTTQQQPPEHPPRQEPVGGAHTGADGCRVCDLHLHGLWLSRGMETDGDLSPEADASGQVLYP